MSKPIIPVPFLRRRPLSHCGVFKPGCRGTRALQTTTDRPASLAIPGTPRDRRGVESPHERSRHHRPRRARDACRTRRGRRRTCRCAPRVPNAGPVVERMAAARRTPSRRPRRAQGAGDPARLVEPARVGLGESPVELRGQAARPRALRVRRVHRRPSPTSPRLSWWVGDLAERDGIQVDSVELASSRRRRAPAEADVAAAAVAPQWPCDRLAAAIGLTRVRRSRCDRALVGHPLEIADVGAARPARCGGAAREMLGMAKASFARSRARRWSRAVELQPRRHRRDGRGRSAVRSAEA